MERRMDRECTPMSDGSRVVFRETLILFDGDALITASQIAEIGRTTVILDDYPDGSLAAQRFFAEMWEGKCSRFGAMSCARFSSVRPRCSEGTSRWPLPMMSADNTEAALLSEFGEYLTVLTKHFSQPVQQAIQEAERQMMGRIVADQTSVESASMVAQRALVGAPTRCTDCRIWLGGPS